MFLISGYDDDLDASIASSFTSAAFRYGHTLVQPTLQRLAEDFKKSEMPAVQMSKVCTN